MPAGITASRGRDGLGLSHHFQERGVGQAHARARLTQLGDHLAAIRDEDLLPAPDEAQVLAQAVLQLTNAHNNARLPSSNGRGASLAAATTT